MNPSRLAQWLVQAAFLVVLGFSWKIATAAGWVSPLFLPPLSRVIHEFGTLIVTGRFWPDLRVTIYELVAAFLIAAVAGSLLGYWVSRSGYAIRVFDPLFASMYSIPTILLIPLYVLFFGLGPASKIAMGATFAFFPIVLNTISGFSNVDRMYVVLAQSMGASPSKLLSRVMLPAAFPAVLTGLRMGLILAFLAVLGAETIASFSGLGHRIVESAENMDTARMFAYILIVLIIAFILNASVSFIDVRGQGEAG